MTYYAIVLKIYNIPVPFCQSLTKRFTSGAHWSKPVFQTAGSHLLTTLEPSENQATPGAVPVGFIVFNGVTVCVFILPPYVLPVTKLYHFALGVNDGVLKREEVQYRVAN